MKWEKERDGKQDKSLSYVERVGWMEGYERETRGYIYKEKTERQQM